jgi:hypothetical protein
LEHFCVKHDRHGNHAVALDLGELLVWCYVCDDYVVGARDALQWLQPGKPADADVVMEAESDHEPAGVHGVGTIFFEKPQTFTLY